MTRPKRSHYSGRSISGKFPSLKLGRMVSFASSLEWDYIYLLDYERDITWFAEQPFPIKYQFGGTTHHYTPDFHVVRGEQHMLIECKPDTFTENEDNQRKWAVARRWCEDEGWSFHVVTDTDLRAHAYLDNVKRLTYYARHAVSPAQRARVYALLAASDAPMALGNLARVLCSENPNQGLADLYHMAFHHEIALALVDAPLSADSLVSWAGRGNAEARL